jgi:hypothetical protein
MSQASSDPQDPFGGDAVIEASASEDPGMTPDMGMAPPPPQYRKQGFSIYSVMLILSFVFLMASAIMFFINAGKF